MKVCPYCAEEIQDAAIVCKHCGRELEPEIVSRITRERASETPFIEAKPAKEVLPAAEAEKLNSIWPYSIGGGFVIAALVSIPRLVSLSEISEAINQGLLSGLAFRAGIQDLALGFVANWIVWALAIAGSMALWRWNRWAVIVPLLLLVALILFTGSDFLGITSLQIFQPPSFSAATSSPTISVAGTSRMKLLFAGATARVATLDAQSGFSGVLLTQGAIRAVALESCQADPMCQLPAPNAAATLEAASTLINPVGTAATWIAGTRAACEASPTCQTNPDPTVAAAITALSGK